MCYILSIGTVYEDVTTDVLGAIGPWQRLVTFLTTIMLIPCLFNQNEDIFHRDSSYISCLPSKDYAVVNISLCSFEISNGTSMPCTRWNVKIVGLYWIKKSWFVYCHNDTELLSSTVIFRLGLMFGCILYGLVSDSFGRRKAIIICTVLETVLSFGVVFCESEGWFRLILFLRSLFSSGNLYITLILVCEIASNSWRSWLCLVTMSPRLIAMMCAVPLARSFSNTESYIFLGSLIEAGLIVGLRWIPESPQWFLYNRKIPYAEKTLIKAAKKNGIHFSGEFKIRPATNRDYMTLEDATATFLGVLNTYNVKFIIFVTIAFWLLYNVQWGCLYLKVFMDKEGRNMGSVISEVFMFLCGSISLTFFLSFKLKLRHLLCVNVTLTGAFAFGSIIFNFKRIQHFLSSVALACGIISHALLLNITPRLFPINMRSTIFGSCNASGQLGVMLVYIVFSLHPAGNDIAFMSIEISISLALAAMCFLLPDVDGRELPDVMEDMDYFSELSKPLRWAIQKSKSASKEEVQIRVYSFGSSGQGTHPEERLPARQIGFVNFWRWLLKNLRKYFNIPIRI